MTTIVTTTTVTTTTITTTVTTPPPLTLTKVVAPDQAPTELHIQRVNKEPKRAANKTIHLWVRASITIWRTVDSHRQ
jgi:hypothetical protein